MLRRVPVSRRQVAAEPRRLVASALAVGTALMLILLLDGLWTGITRSVTAYEDQAGADLFVAENGTRNFFGAVSQIPAGTADDIRTIDGVRWAAPIRTFLAILTLHDRKVPVSVIGWDPQGPGGPWTINEGRPPRADDEIAIGEAMANRHGIRVGTRLAVMGHEFTVVGTSTDTFMLSFLFMTRASSDAVLQAPGTTSFVLVSTDNPDAVRSFAAVRGLTVLDRDQLAANDVKVMTRAYAVPMTVMRLVAFAIGVLVVTLTVYATIVDRRREYGIVKAMGGNGWMLWRIAFGHTVLIAVAGFLASVPLFLVARTVIAAVRPQFWIILTTGSVVRGMIVAAVMAIVASMLPARRLAVLEPAVAYGGG